MWLVDTGATRSIVSIETYRRYLGHCPLEKVRAPMTAINGSSIEVLGKCRLTIGLNGRDYTHRFLVAGIDNAGVLGRDFLRTHRCYWNWEANTLEIDGQEIKCRVPVIAEEPTIEVKAVRSYVIPARTEMVIEGTIAGHERPLTTGMISGQGPIHEKEAAGGGSDIGKTPTEDCTGKGTKPQLPEKIC